MLLLVVFCLITLHLWLGIYFVFLKNNFADLLCYLCVQETEKSNLAVTISILVLSYHNIWKENSSNVRFMPNRRSFPTTSLRDEFPAIIYDVFVRSSSRYHKVKALQLSAIFPMKETQRKILLNNDGIFCKVENKSVSVTVSKT